MRILKYNAIYIICGIGIVIFVAAIIISEWEAYIDSTVTHGTVVDKYYTPSHTVIMPVSTGKTTCIVPIYYSEHWNVRVKGIDCNDHERYVSWPVEEKNYYTIKIGDSIDRR